MKQSIERQTVIVDASGKAFGRLASEITRLLRGKHKPSFLPHIDGGDVVEVLHVNDMVITGDKRRQKLYYRHSQYPGNLKQENLARRIERKGMGEILRGAVFNMLPKNKLRPQMMKRLIISETKKS